MAPSAKWRLGRGLLLSFWPLPVTHWWLGLPPCNPIALLKSKPSPKQSRGKPEWVFWPLRIGLGIGRLLFRPRYCLQQQQLRHNPGQWTRTAQAEEPPTHWLPCWTSLPTPSLPPTHPITWSLSLSSCSSPFPLTPTPAPPTQLLRLIFPPPPLVSSFLRDGGRSTGLGCLRPLFCSRCAAPELVPAAHLHTPVHTARPSTTSMVPGILFLSSCILVSPICPVRLTSETLLYQNRAVILPPSNNAQFR